jgi:hypothetical protein
VIGMLPQNAGHIEFSLSSVCELTEIAVCTRSCEGAVFLGRTAPEPQTRHVHNKMCMVHRSLCI